MLSSYQKWFWIRLAIAILLVLTVGPVAQGSYPGKKEFGEDCIRAIVENTHLVFVGEVIAVEYQCMDQERANAYVSLGAVECWSGHFPTGSKVRIHGVVIEGCDAPRDQSRPNPIEVGSRYLFLCNRAWSWDTHEFQDELFVSVKGILCIGEDKEISYCGGGFRFAFENPGKKLKENLELIGLEQMEQDSDLVVVATDFKIPGQPEEFRYAQVENSTECRVLTVIKGECSEPSFKFNFHAGAFGIGSTYRALISSTDKAVLFLKEGSNGFGLIYGAKSYLPLDGDEVLSNYRLPMGAKLFGNRIVRVGQ